MTHHLFNTFSPGSKKKNKSSNQTQESVNDTDETPSANDRINSLRNGIIDFINKAPEHVNHYPLASFLWDRDRFGVDGVWYTLNLETKTINVEESDYPNAFGYYRERKYSLSASDFAKRAPELLKEDSVFLLFKTQDDWDKLFDDSLQNEVNKAKQKNEEKRKKEMEEKRLRFAIKIPGELLGHTPCFDIKSVDLALDQAFAFSNAKIENLGNTYHISYTTRSNRSNNFAYYESKDTTAAESVWLETQVKNALSSSDETTWQSLPGGDTMSVLISMTTGGSVRSNHTKPLKKYSQLMDSIRTLAEYGSVVE